MKSADSILKIVIVHEDSITGLLAVGLLKRAADQLERVLGTEFDAWQICHRIWQFKWLRSPDLWEEAVSISAEADMIIISANDHRKLPACVRSWIESVLPRKHGGPAILVTMLDGQQIARMGSLPPAQCLRQLADHHGVNFFCNLDDRPAHILSGTEPTGSSAGDAPGIIPSDLHDKDHGAAMVEPWNAACCSN